MRKQRIFWGLFFIAIAAVMIANQLGMLGGFSMMQLVLGMLFAAMLVKSALYRSISGVLFAAACLGSVFAEELGIGAWAPWTLLSIALFLSIGFHFLLQPKKKYVDHGQAHSFSKSVEHVSDDELSFHTSFGESIKYVNSNALEKAYLTCSFGSMKVHFENAGIQEEAYLYMDVDFCGVDLYVPKNWQVVNRMHTSFGGINEKNHNAADGTAPRLILSGNLSFAGITITYI